MRLERTLLATLLLWLPLAGCPKGGPPATSGGDCFRDVEGDLATARRRLERGVPEEAKLYVDALARCKAAWENQDYLDVAGRVAEDLGDLNGAWRAAKAAQQLAVRDGDGDAADRWQQDLRSFSTRYVWLEVRSEERQRPSVRYAGAVVDDATFRQLEDVSAGRTVRSPTGAEGFWVFPGRYKVGDLVRTLEAGQQLSLSYNKEGTTP